MQSGNNNIPFFWSSFELIVDTAARRICSVTLALTLLCSAAVSSFADSPARPRVYEKTFGENAEYLFRMVPSGEGSGLFRNDGTGAAVWTVDWYAFNVDVTADGRNLVRWGPWASSLEQLAVAFYVNGKLIREYPISALVDDPVDLPSTISHFTWLASSKIDDERKLLHLETIPGDSYVFSLETGEQIQKTPAPESDQIARIKAVGKSEIVLRGPRVCWSGPFFWATGALSPEALVNGFLLSRFQKYAK